MTQPPQTSQGCTDMAENRFIVIERQWSESLAIEYPTEAEANDALVNSLLIDGLCEEDCLDCYTKDHVPEWATHLLPPDPEEEEN